MSSRLRSAGWSDFASSNAACPGIKTCDWFPLHHFPLHRHAQVVLQGDDGKMIWWWSFGVGCNSSKSKSLLSSCAMVMIPHHESWVKTVKNRQLLFAKPSWLQNHHDENVRFDWRRSDGWKWMLNEYTRLPASCGSATGIRCYLWNG